MTKKNSLETISQNITKSTNSTRMKTTSHPEMVSDMSRVTLNFNLSKIPFVHF